MVYDFISVIKASIRLKVIVIAILLLGFLLSSCQGETEQRYRLTSFEKRRLDTLYEQELQVLRPKLDSLCEFNYEKRMQATIDSLVQLGRMEADALRQRNPLEE